MHVDTGHNFAEVLDYRDRRVEELGRAARRRLGAGVDRHRPGRRGDRARRRAATACRPSRCSTPSSSTASTPCSAVGAATRRRPGPRSACTRSATTSVSGTRRTSAPSCGTSTTAGTARASTSACSRSSNWTELDIWQYIEDEEHRAPVDLLRAPARGVPPRRHVARGVAVRHVDGRRGARGDDRALPHGRRRDCTGAVESPADNVDDVIAEVAAVAHHRARRDPGRRQVRRSRHGRPQARGLLLDGDAAVRHRGIGRRRQEHAHRAPAARHASRSSRTSSRRSSAPAATRASTTRTSRCSPTASGPSASRASPSTSRTATSPRRGASSSSPTPPATCSTRATWSPARRPPTSRSC